MRSTSHGTGSAECLKFNLKPNTMIKDALWTGDYDDDSSMSCCEEIKEQITALCFTSTTISVMYQTR